MRWHGPEWRSSLPRACSRSVASIAKSAACVARLCSISKLPRPTKNRRREVYKLLISADELRQKLPARDWLVFDVRHDLADHSAGRQAYEQGHIPGALFLDHEAQLSAPKTGSNGRHPFPDRRDFPVLIGLRSEELRLGK